MEKSTEVDGAVPAMQDAMEAVRSQAEAVARSQAGSIIASTVPLLNDVASLLVRAHDEGQRSITGGPTVPDPSLLTQRFSDPLVCTTGGTEAQAVAAALQSFCEKRTRDSDDSWEDDTPHSTVKSVDGTSHQYPFGSQMQRQQAAVLTSGGVLTSDTLTYGLTLNQHNELVPHGGRVEEKRQQLEASAEAERLQAFEKLPEAERQQAFREQYPDGTPPARNTRRCLHYLRMIAQLQRRLSATCSHRAEHFRSKTS